MDEQACRDTLDGMKRVTCTHCGAENVRPLKFFEQLEGRELIVTCGSCLQQFDVQA
jgi:RNase P subunit RPR2